MYLDKQFVLSVWLLAIYPTLFRIVATAIQGRDNQLQTAIALRFFGWTIGVALVLLLFPGLQSSEAEKSLVPGFWWVILIMIVAGGTFISNAKLFWDSLWNAHIR